MEYGSLITVPSHSKFMSNKLISCFEQGKLRLLGETNTEYSFVCPVCGGKLKLNKRTGAYKCFTSYCDTNDIRSRLGLFAGVTEHFKPSISHILTPQKPPIFSNYIPLLSDYVAPKTRIAGVRKITNYEYNKECIVERVDYVSEQRKELFPKYKTGNIWKYGVSSKFNLFNLQFVRSSGTLIIAEGEKTADTITRITNYVCVTPPMFGWTEDYIARNLVNPLIKSVLYLPDNDEAGIKKAAIVQKSCWLLGIGVKIFNYGDLLLNDGDDFVDLVERGINIKELLDDYLN